jgi:hypothetical protein
MSRKRLKKCPYKTVCRAYKFSKMPEGRYHVAVINSTLCVMRDNFPPRVIRDLERRVNSKCSNPDHRVPTSGPTGARENSVNIGVAAHIFAAAPGGPRYDPLMTREGRSDISNGIWLCQNCAGMIDRDTKTYTVAVLKRWRESAEIRAKEELGQIPVSREHYDAMHSVVFGSGPRLTSLDPVATMCRLAAESLEKKDPRFKVEVERTRNKTMYTYLARENVEFSLSVAKDFTAEFSEKLARLVRHGEDLKIASGAISLEGSPLFEHFQGAEGVFVLSPTTRKSASVLIELGDKAGNKNFFAEINGEIVGGSESVHFQGKGLNGLFQLELTLPRNSTRVRVNSVIDFAIWDTNEINTLSNFNRIWSYYECATAGRTVKLMVEVDGKELALLEGKAPTDEISNFAMIAYIFNARKIAAALGQPIRFDSNASITWDEFNAAHELRLRMNLTTPKELQSNPVMTLAPAPGKALEDVLRDISMTAGALSLEQELEPLPLFKQVLPAFKLVTTFSNVRLERIGEPDDGIVTVEVVPNDLCELNCSIRKLGELSP